MSSSGEEYSSRPRQRRRIQEIEENEELESLPSDFEEEEVSLDDQSDESDDLNDGEFDLSLFRRLIPGFDDLVNGRDSPEPDYGMKIPKRVDNFMRVADSRVNTMLSIGFDFLESLSLKQFNRTLDQERFAYIVPSQEMLQDVSEGMKKFWQTLTLTSYFDKSVNQPLQFGWIGLVPNVECKIFKFDGLFSTSNHFQCQCALTLGSRERLMVEDGTAKFIQKPFVINDAELCTIEDSDSQDPHLYKFTKTIYIRSILNPIFNNRISEELPGPVLCSDQKYGYFAGGDDDGNLFLRCMTCVHNQQSDSDDEQYGIDGQSFIFKIKFRHMVNSVQIFRRESAELVEFLLVASVNNGLVVFWQIPGGNNHGPVNQLLAVKFRQPVNDSKVSPNGQWLACVGDLGLVCILPIQNDYDKSASEGWNISPQDVVTLQLPDMLKLYKSSDQFQGQYLSWHSHLDLFATSCDSHPCVALWTPKGCVQVIGTGDVTFAIDFNPVFTNFLATGNRRGFVHVMDLSTLCQQVEIGESVPIPKSETQVTRDVLITAIDVVESSTDPIMPRLDPINGLKWDSDGNLFVSCTHRTLFYTFLPAKVPTLLNLCIEKLWTIKSDDLFRKVEENVSLDTWQRFQRWKNESNHE